VIADLLVLQAECPSCHPSNSAKALKALIISNKDKGKQQNRKSTIK